MGETKITVDWKWSDGDYKSYSVSTGGEVNFQEFMEMFKGLAGQMYSHELVEEYWK